MPGRLPGPENDDEGLGVGARARHRQVDVIDHTRQTELLQELKMQQSALYDKTRAADIGKRLGVDYFITGKGPIELMTGA